MRSDDNNISVSHGLEEDAEISIHCYSKYVGLCLLTNIENIENLFYWPIKRQSELLSLTSYFSDWAHLKLHEEKHFYQGIVFLVKWLR